MGKTSLRVQVLEVTSNALSVIYAACRQCYSSSFAGDIFSGDNSGKEKQEEFVKKVVNSGHESPLEHVKFTFAVEGVSRALTHQLVRHRLASYCLTGDTIIKGARQKSRGYKRFTLKSLYERTLTPHGKSRLKLIRLNSYDEGRKVFTKGKIENIVYTGKQMVWKVNLVNNQSIKATLNHRFFSRNGWLTLGEIIQAKPELGVNGITCQEQKFALLRDKDWLNLQYNSKSHTQEEIADEIGCSKHTVKSWVRKHGIQKENGGLHGHQPRRGYHWRLNRARTFEEKQAISEKMKGPNNPMWRGGITKEAARLRKQIPFRIREKVYERDGYRCRLCYNLGGKLTLHHKIPIYADKARAVDIDNLVTLCRKCHWKLNNHEAEYKDFFGINTIPYHSRSQGCYRVIKWVKIKSIEPYGIEDTYDIVMQDPHHNFVADGFVVHNSQMSQRYVKADDFNYIVPPSIEEDKEMKEEFLKAIAAVQKSYNKLLSWFKHKGKKGEIANQDARFILPQAAETKIVVTMNCRELLHFFSQRCCTRAQWEIRGLANEMLRICKERLPAVFDKAGAKCEKLGYCPEGKKFTCGRYPLKEEVFKALSQKNTST